MASSSATLSSRSNIGPTIGSNDLAKITKLEVAHEESTSRGPFEGGKYVNDPGSRTLPPTRRSTHPPVPCASDRRAIAIDNQIGDFEPAPPARAKTSGNPKRSGDILRRQIFNRIKPGDSSPELKASRTASTVVSEALDQPSLASNFSLSFEDSAIWDQKAILSLGKS